MRDVVAALIWDGDRFMICQRPENKARALLWEFVGGKVEEGETKEMALIRECNEELGIKVKVNDLYMELDHIYPDITIHLSLFNCEIIEGRPQLLEHHDLKWISIDEIDDYEFCPADEDILKQLKKRKTIYCLKVLVPGMFKLGTCLNFEETMKELEENGSGVVSGLKRFIGIVCDDADEKLKLIQRLLKERYLDNLDLYSLDEDLIKKLLISLDGKLIYPKEKSKVTFFKEGLEK